MEQQEETRYDWSIAPEWAQWAATDKDGEMYWYDKKPLTGGISWINNHVSVSFDIAPECKDWKDSLEARPPCN